jgi:hypothetical protein
MRNPHIERYSIQLTLRTLLLLAFGNKKIIKLSLLHIGSSCIYLPTTKDIWDHLSHMYSGTGNITRIYVVCKLYFGVEQGKQTVDECYNQFVAICKERNLYQPPSTDLKKREKQHQDVNVVWFLLGKKPEVDLVHAQILGGSNLPSLLEVFPQIQRATLFYHSSQLSFERTGECSTFISSHGSFGCSHGGHGGQCGRDSRSSGRTGSHEPQKCTHCGRSNQSIHFCCDLYNEPSSFANQAFSLEDYLAISGPLASSSLAPHYDLISILKDEYAQFLVHKRATFSSTTTLAQLGSASLFLSSPTCEP